MKVKKRLMVALAGAMILGVFGTSGVPVMADASEPDFMVSIPADLMITHAGENEAGDLIMSANRPGTIVVSADNNVDENGFRHLVNTKDPSQEIEYELKYYYDVIYYDYLGAIWKDIYDTGTTYRFPIKADVKDYSDKPPGEYKATVTFTATLNNLPVS